MRAGDRELELTAWLREQSEPRIVVKDPHAAWLVDTWAAASRSAGRDLRLLTAIRHPAEVVGSQDLTWGHRRDDEMRRVKETSNVAAWLNVALVTERSGRDLPRSFLRYSELIEDWRSALGRVSTQLDLGLDTDPGRAGHELDDWLDPSLRRSQVSWDDIVVPSWLRDLAEDAWGQLNRLVGDPQEAAATARLDEIRVEYDARYAEGVALTLDEARHRERLGARNAAAKFRPRVQRHKRRAERRPRRRTAPRRAGRAAPQAGLTYHRQVRIVLHAGLHKSGTTSVQSSWRAAYPSGGPVWFPTRPSARAPGHHGLVRPLLSAFTQGLALDTVATTTARSLGRDRRDALAQVVHQASRSVSRRSSCPARTWTGSGRGQRRARLAARRPRGAPAADRDPPGAPVVLGLADPGQARLAQYPG